MNKLSAFFICATITGGALADDDKAATTSASSSDEEMLVLGKKRQGDYAYITEDTQKLVETAGALGDPLSAIFALPGVVYSAGEGSEPAVRGSSPFDNQYIVDFMPASYIFHEFGVSIFSEYILSDFQMYSAGVGAEYNDVTGAVFDVRLRDPNNQKIGGTLDLSMLRSGIFLEGGVTENSAFYLSHRRSLLHLFINEEALSDEDEGIEVQKIPQDSDYQFKYLWTPNERHRISLNANGARDEAAAEFTAESELVRSNPDFAGDASLDERFRGRNILWEYDGENGTEFKLGFGLLNDISDLNWGDSEYVLVQDRKRKTLKSKYSFLVTDRFRLSLGAEKSKFETGYVLDMPLFICTEFDPDCETRRRGRVQADNAIEWEQEAAFVSGIWTPSNKITLELGGHYQTNDFNEQSFVNPRASASYKLFNDTTLIAKAGRYNQFPNTEFIFQESGNPELRSPTSDHFTLGVQQAFSDGWSLSVDTYYKTFSDLPLALAEDDADAELRYASDTEGMAYGVDILLNKDLTDRLYGWISLSYSKSERKNLRTMQTREYRLDTPLIFNWVLNWQATSTLNFGWRWSIRSGVAYTPIIGVQENPYFENSVLPVYGEEFSDRLPLYNRLDFRVKWDTSFFGKDAALILDVLNATNNQNVEERVLDYDKNLQPGDEPQTIDIVGLGISPALTYRISF